MAYGEDYEYWYRGQPSTFEPEYSKYFTGYKMNAEKLGETTNPATAAQVSAVSEKLRQGMKTIEMATVSPQLFESIPRQHFEQIKDMAKLTGAEISIHTPLNPNIDVVGVGESGRWSEESRKEAERRMMNIIDRSHDIDPKGNTVITIHPTMATSAEWTPEGKDAITIINPETGEMGGIKGKEHFYPGYAKAEKKTPEEEVDILNDSLWRNQLMEIETAKREVDIYLKNAVTELNRLDVSKVNSAIEKSRAGKSAEVTDGEKAEYMRFEDINERIIKAQRALAGDLEPSINAIFNKAYADEKVRDDLKKLGSQFNKEITKNREEIEKIAEKDHFKAAVTSAISSSRAQDMLINGLEKIKPETYRQFGEFAKEKGSETISQLALDSYDKYKDNSPILALENVYPGVAFSRAEDLKELVVESRKKFVEKAVSEGISRGEAENAAKKIIGATWDIAHANMLKGKGFKEEQIIEETKKIAPYIKKVHVSDNFGFADTHLAPSMGNVATKRHLKEMEKSGSLKDKVKVIAELGGLHQQFKVPSAYPYALESMGSSIYSAEMAPYWQRPVSRASLVPVEGGSFAPIPTELGGTTQKKQYTTE